MPMPKKPVTPRLDEDQYKELEGAFQLFDLDGGGDIDGEELGTVMRSLGQNPSQAEVEAMIAEVDVDGSGSIAFPEFAKLMARKIQVDDCEVELRDAFMVFAEEDDGCMSNTSLRVIIRSLADHLSDEEIDEIIRVADSEALGRITVDQFIDLMQGATRRPPSDMGSRPPSELLQA